MHELLPGHKLWGSVIFWAYSNSGGHLSLACNRVEKNQELTKAVTAKMSALV